MKKFLLSVLLALCLVSAATPACAYNVPDFIPNCVDLYFPSNPTTGYSWTAEAEDESVVEIKEQYFSDSAELGFTGAGGTHWFHFDGLKEGVSSVTLRYARPWEEKEPVYQFVFRFSVDEKLNVLIWGVEMGDGDRTAAKKEPPQA